MRCVERQGDLADAGIALAAVALRLTIVPLRMASRMPGVSRLAAEGASIRARTLSVAEARVLETLDDETTQRLVRAVLSSPGFERLMIEATDRVLRGPEMARVIESVASSPEVRRALTEHSTTMAEEMVDDVRRHASTFDDVAERTVRGWLRRPRPA
jgi:hypothetical protein